MPKDNESYQALQAQLDDIMLQLQSSDVDIDQAVKQYEAALKLIAKLEAYLQTAENQIRQIGESYKAKK